MEEQRKSSIFWDGITPEEEAQQIIVRKRNYDILSKIIELSFSLVVNTPTMNEKEHHRYHKFLNNIDSNARSGKELLRNWADEVGDYSL